MSTTTSAKNILSEISSSVLSGVHNIQEKLEGAMSTVMDAPSVSRADISLLEENERRRRIGNAQEQATALKNAEDISRLLKGSSFRLSSGSAGFKRYTSRIERAEQSRRIVSLDETRWRRANAQKASRLVRSLGWPFIRGNGLTFVEPNPAELAELAEQWRRTNDVEYKIFGRAHGQRVSQLLQGAKPLSGSSGFKRFTRHLEEKERSRRLRERSELAVSNAWEESHCIARLGWPFNAQSGSLDYQKDAWSSFDKSEEAERTRALADKSGIKLRKMNAAKVASVFFGYELSRGVEYLEEKERASRLEDSDTFRGHAAREAALISEASLRNIARVEDEERDRRLADTEEQALFQHNGQVLSSLIRRAYGFFLEEQERDRRLARRASEQGKIDNARQVSAMIPEYPMSGLKHSSGISAAPVAAPLSTGFASTPVATAPVSTFTSTPVTSFAPTSSFVATPATTFVAPTTAGSNVVIAPTPAAYPVGLGVGLPVGAPAATSTILPQSRPVTFLNSKELKSLSKSAAKHDKAAAKEFRKAEKLMTKANKYQARGKANKAASAQQNALKHEQAAKQHESVAIVEHSKLAPAAPTAVGSPLM